MDEEQIITLFFARSEQAIEALDAKYGKLFHSLSYHIVNDRQDADECVNDAYLGAWNAIPPAKPDSLLPYMARIVRNISLKCYWKKGAAKRNSPYTLALQEVEECLPDRKSAEEEVEARELARVIACFLDTLPGHRRACRAERKKYLRPADPDPKEAETISGRKRGVFMNAKKFSDALSALDGRYVEEAARYRRKHGQSFWVRWGAAAACLCLLAAGGALLIQGRGRAAPDPQQVQIPNTILTVASAAEMEAYLDFKVPVLEKEVEAYSVFISDGYPTMGQVDYADGSQFRIQYGSGDISGIYGGTLEESREIAGVSVAYYQYDSMSYAIWEVNGFACSYLYTNGGDAEVDLLIQQGP